MRRKRDLLFLDRFAWSLGSDYETARSEQSESEYPLVSCLLSGLSKQANIEEKKGKGNERTTPLTTRPYDAKKRRKEDFTLKKSD